MIDAATIRTLVPHGGSMCLLQTVERWDPVSIECATETHRDPQNPLRRESFLSSVHLVEYAVQAAALHAALSRGEGEGPLLAGMLAVIRNLRLAVDHIDTQAATLKVMASRLLVQPEGVLYDFKAYCAGSELAQGRFAIALVDSGFRPRRDRPETP